MTRIGRTVSESMTVAAATLAAAMTLGATAVKAAGDSAAGEKTAIQWCARCHVIGDQNPYGGINSTPSFWIMAKKPEVYSAKVLTFYQRRPHAALEFDVSKRDIADIHAYIQTLKPQ